MKDDARFHRLVLAMLALLVAAVAIVCWWDDVEPSGGASGREVRTLGFHRLTDEGFGAESVRREKVSHFRRSILLDPPLRDEMEPGVLSDRRLALRAPLGERVWFEGPLEGAFTLRVSYRPTVSPAYDRARHGEGANWNVRLHVSIARVDARGRRAVLAEETPWYRGAKTFGWRELATSVRDLRADERLELVARLDMVQEPLPLEIAFANPVLLPLSPRNLPPNVVIVSLDAVRADHLSCYGHTRETTPVIDALAREGVRFERALSPSNWSMTSYGTLFTGLHPPAHRAGLFQRAAGGPTDAQEVRHYKDLNPGASTLAERLRQGGWATAGFHSNLFLEPWYGFDRGFDTWVRYHGGAQVGVDLAIDWVEKRAGAPIFLFLHLMDAHFPYDSPEAFRARFEAEDPLSDELVKQLLRANAADLREETWARLHDLHPSLRENVERLYDASIAYADEQIGRLVDVLRAQGRLDRTIFVVHSDHGEGFWEHGEFRHGRSFHDEVVHVPLILRAPGILPAGHAVSAPVTVADLPQALLELLDLPSLNLEREACLLTTLRGAVPASHELISSGALFRGYEGALWNATERWVVREDRVLRYALVDDAEREPLAVEKDEDDDVRRHVRAWVEAQRRFGDSLSAERTEFLLSPAMERELAALGYLGH